MLPVSTEPRKLTPHYAFHRLGDDFSADPILGLARQESDCSYVTDCAHLLTDRSRYIGIIPVRAAMLPRILMLSGVRGLSRLQSNGCHIGYTQPSSEVYSSV